MARLSTTARAIAIAGLLVTAAPTLAAAQNAGENIKTKTLANGLEIIVIEDHSVPLITVEIVVKNGAYTEPPEFNGLSHLYEHMFFKGNAVIPTQEKYLQRMRELGIVFNGTTSTERVNYFFTLPSTNLEPGMEFMRDAIVTPKFDEGEFKKEIQVVIGEVDRNESNPYYWLGQAIDQKLWFAHPTRKDSLGDRETITTATVEKMKMMQERYYVPNNSALLIAGDVDPARAFELAESMYSGWTASAKNPHEAYPVPAHPALPKSEAVVVNKPVQAPYFSMSWHGPSVTTDPKATYAADVFSYIIGQPTSKFYKNMVESGVTLGASVGYYTQAHTGPINAAAQVQPGQVKPAIKAFLKEVYKFTDPDYFTDEQLASAKQILAIQSIYEQEKTSSLIHTVSFWWATANLDYYKTYVSSLEAVTREDISKYVKDYIWGKPFILGVLASEQAAAGEGLTKEELDKFIAEIEAEVAKEMAAK